MDERLTAEILATYNSIGYSDEEKYYKNTNCLECVKALVLYMRRDDDNHSIRRLLGQAQVVQRDLLPLLKHYYSDLELYDVVLRLLLNLTSPALVVYEEDIPQNKRYRNFYNQIEEHLRSYKTAFVDELLWKSLTDRLRLVVNIDDDERTLADKTTIERILIVIRNILKVAADPAEEKRSDDDMSIHDRIIMVMNKAGVTDILLSMASSDSDFCHHVLEIISLILREQTGEQLAKTNLTRNEEDKMKDERELIEIREKEIIQNIIQNKKFSTRHSRFGGTFVIRDLEAPSGRGLLCHKPISSVADLSLDSTKKRKRTANNRLTMVEENPTRRSTNSCRLVLKEFSSKFLSEAYNTLMRIVKNNIDRGRTQDHDETYYLWALRFFMEFNRFHNPNNFRLDYVSETMSTAIFHYIQTLLDNYHGMMVTDKEKIPFWSRRAHSAIQAYKELLFTVAWMDKCGDESVKESSRAIKRNVFYLPEYRELCFGLLTNYDPVKLSKLYLKDVIETNHLFLKMLEEFSTSSERIMVKTKGKKRKKTKHGKKAKKPRRGSTKSSSELEEAWNGVSGQISSALLSSELPDEAAAGAAANGYVNVIPFDAASDVPIDEQKTTAVERIAIFLHTGKHAAAITLLRAAREVWPDSPEEFGESADPDEISVLKTIFVDQGNHTSVKTAVEAMTSNNEEDEEKEENPGDEERNENSGTEGDNEDEEHEQEVAVIHKEVEFDYKGFLLKYANPKIVCNYARMFTDWDTLDPLTLHCVMKMFHRFVFQLDYPSLICQASIFRTFQKIMQVADYRKDLKEVAQFFYHFWPKFVAICEKNKHMFMEILFWKSATEAMEIQEGYGSYTASKAKSKVPRPKKTPGQKGQKRTRKQKEAMEEQDPRLLNASDSDSEGPTANGNASDSNRERPNTHRNSSDSDNERPIAKGNVSDSDNEGPTFNGISSDSDNEGPTANGNASDIENLEHKKVTKKQKVPRKRKGVNRALSSDSENSKPTANGNVSDPDSIEPTVNGNASDSESLHPTPKENASDSEKSDPTPNGNASDSDNLTSKKVTKRQKQTRKPKGVIKEKKRVVSSDSEPTANGNASDSDNLESIRAAKSQKQARKPKRVSNEKKRQASSDSDDSKPAGNGNASDSDNTEPNQNGNASDSESLKPADNKNASDSENAESIANDNASISKHSTPTATGMTLNSDDESEVGLISPNINPKRKRARLILDSSDED